MTTLTSSTTDVGESLNVVELKSGTRFSIGVLRALLPDIATLLFFCKVYDLAADKVSYLLRTLFDSDLVQALTADTYSHDLQDYVVDTLVPALPVDKRKKVAGFVPTPPPGEVLPELWKQLEVEVAQSIKDVATKLAAVVGQMPGKKANMVFNTMLKVNARRPTLGDYRAQIVHPPTKDNLIIFDVSGSMTESTVRSIVGDVVALSYMANAHLAIVSFSTTHWEPGTFNVDDVLQAAEFGGTHYESLRPLFDRDWGVVVTIADYDSSAGAKGAIAQCAGRIDKVVDVSLVNRPTFLAECVGQLADSVQPMLIAPSRQVLGS